MRGALLRWCAIFLLFLPLRWRWRLASSTSLLGCLLLVVCHLRDGQPLHFLPLLHEILRIAGEPGCRSLLIALGGARFGTGESFSVGVVPGLVVSVLIVSLR